MKDEFFKQVGALPKGIPSGRWKVTARYELQTKDGPVKCVRVRLGCGPSWHFTQEVFDKLFKPITEKK
jgi:hypothetical protein